MPDRTTGPGGVGVPETRRDSLLPNAGIVARREYRDRVRSPFFVLSTLVLMTLAMGVALAPIALRAVDRQTVTRVLVVAPEPALGLRAVAVADSMLNIAPTGADPKTWTRPFQVSLAADEAAAMTELETGRLGGGVLVVDRLPTGQLDVTYRTNGTADAVRSQLVGFSAIALAILDWTAALPPGSQLGSFQQPNFAVEPINVATDGGRKIDAQEMASRQFLGIVFVVLLFLTVIIYGMWVATGVAAEKSSRVMELMISAASPRQLLTGKVVGIGAAGLTQYALIALPALLVVVFQDRIAMAVMGPGAVSDTPINGLTIPLPLGYGLFFLLGFTLFALVYAAMGSFVSRPDDLQTMSLPLSIVAMAGYLSAVVALSGGVTGWTTIASIVPPFSPFVMLARLMVGAVPPWQVVLSVGLLVGAIIVVAVAAARMYEAGVLLYGQRPSLRAFLAAARRAS